MTTTDEQTKFLSIYLEDHAAGATAGAQRAARLAEAEAESADATVLAKFSTGVAADLDALLAVMAALGIEPNRLKAGVASVAEKVGALKLNGKVFERSPLSTIVEIEAMQMAVRGKRSLWETLQVAVSPSTSSSTSPSTPADLDALIARADDQLEALAGLHAARVAATFAS